MSAAASANEPARRPRLAQRRKALGLTQEDLAGLLAVERTTVVRWERGDSEPLPWLRPRLARALRVSAERLDELLSGDGTTAPVPRQLPATVTHFTGRAAELGTLTQIFDDAAAPGTVIISAIGGTAGVGKTALALHWSHQAAHRFPGGQLYVNLRGYDPDRPVTAADALAGFLRALGVPGQDIPPDEAERAARYRSLLAGRRVLVVLDNAGSVEQVGPLLPGSPSCAVVVTSRDALAGLVVRYGAARLDLDLLPPDDAITLLRELIGKRAADEPGAVAALADRCCHLPLALRVAAELAASRPGVPLAGLAAELADEQSRLDVLDAGGDPRTAVRAVFSWSYRRLDAATARVFRLAGLHPGADFEPYAIAALAGTGLADARRALDALSRAHLIQPAAHGRYSMHDLLRGYARELAASQDSDDDRHAALTRLFDHYLHAAATAMDTLHPARRDRRPRVTTPATPVPPLGEDATALAWLDAELATLTAVVVHAAGKGWPGHATELSVCLWMYLDLGGHYQEAAVIYESARDAARRVGDPAAEATALNSLAGVHYNQGQWPPATGHLDQALMLFRQAGDRAGQSRVLANLGLLHYGRGNYHEAASLIMRGLDINRENGELWGQAAALNGLGTVAERLGQYEQAGQYFGQSLAISREIRDQPGEFRELVNLGFVQLGLGHPDQAADLATQSLRYARESGNKATELQSLTCLGLSYLRLGRFAEAAWHLEQAIAVAQATSSRNHEAEALTFMGELLLATGRPGDAHASLTAALGVTTKLDLKFERAHAQNHLGRACLALGDDGRARNHWQEALAIYTELGVPEAAEVRARLDAMPGATA